MSSDSSPSRLLSLDALRGFDMFWIIGGSVIITELARLCPFFNGLATQMHHVSWEGFRFYDLIFPLFVFIAGISMAYAAAARRAQGKSDSQMLLRLLKRAGLLVLLGLIYNGAMNFDFVHLRYPSVLGLIGISCLLAGLIALKTDSIRALLFWALGIGTAVWAMQNFMTLGMWGNGSFEAGKIINAAFDSCLPGRLNSGSWDPEGPLNILSATVLPLCGCAVGRLILLYQTRKLRIAFILAGVGTAAVLSGFALSPYYPVIKCAWTGSFNLVTGGFSLLLFILFYTVIDIWKIQKWSFGFRVIGLNAITIYLAHHFINFGFTNTAFFSGTAELFETGKGLILAITFVLLEWGLLEFLRRRNCFLKV